jgi:hypothetical protein
LYKERIFKAKIKGDFMARCKVCDKSIADGLIFCSNCEGNKLVIDATNNVIKEMAKLGGVPTRLLPYYNPAPSGGSTAQPPKPVAPVATPKQSAPPPVVKPVSPPPNNKDTFEKAKALYNEDKYEEAVFIFKSLAEQNNTEAMHFLAICYQFGRGIKKDAAKAEEWKEKRYKEESKKIWPNRK